MHGVRLWKLEIKIIGKFFAFLFQKKPLLDFQYSPLYAKLLNLRHKMKKLWSKRQKTVCAKVFFVVPVAKEACLVAKEGLLAV